MKLANPNLSRGTMTAIAVVMALMVAGIWWSSQQHAAAAQAERRWRAQQEQWQALAASDPAPTAAAVAELGRKVDSAQGVVQQLRDGLGETRNDPVKQAEIPAARADAFFALVRFMERQHEQARAAGVRLVEGEAFGFSAYRNSGPADEHIEMVHFQMEALTVALAALWRAQPDEFLQVKRENPATKLTPLNGERVDRPREGRPEDWLSWSAERSLAWAGVLDTLAVRLSWVGRTATLRAWLSELRRGSTPLVVRQVEVEPLGVGGRPVGGRRGLADLFRDQQLEVSMTESGSANVVPLISENRSVFHVTFEYLNFAVKTAPSENAGMEEGW